MFRSHPACKTSPDCKPAFRTAVPTTTVPHLRLPLRSAPSPITYTRESKPRRETKSHLLPKQGPRRKEKKKNPPNCKRSTYTAGNVPQPGPPSSLAALVWFGPWIHDSVFSWLSLERFVFATGQHYEYVVATAQHSKSLKTLRTRLWHEGRRTPITTQVFHPSGSFPTRCLSSKPGTSLSLHLYEGECLEVKSEVKNGATSLPPYIVPLQQIAQLCSALAGRTFVEWRWSGIAFAQITSAMHRGQLLSKPPWKSTH